MQKNRKLTMPRRYLFLLMALCYAVPAWAYLDPGTGSMIISAIVGLVASIALGLKTYWYKFLRLFRRKPKNLASTENPDE